MKMIDGHKITRVHGDMHPVEVRRNGIRISGWVNDVKSGTSVSFEDCYNDVADVVVYGNTVQEQAVYAKNIITNGNFSVDTNSDNVADGWTNSTGISLLNNVQRFALQNIYSTLQQVFTPEPGDIYFFSIFAKGDTSDTSSWVHVGTVDGTNTAAIAIVSDGAWRRYDLMLKATKLDANFGMRVMKYLNDTNVYYFEIKYAICINISKTFGYGTEPSKTQIGAMLGARYPDYWFDGVSILTTDTVTYKSNGAVYDVTGNLKSRNTDSSKTDSAAIPDLRSVNTTRDEWRNRTGKKLKRCERIESYAGETITTPYISSTGGLNTGATIVYQLATPIEESYTPHDLQTFYPSTVIETDCVNSIPTLTATVKIIE